MAGCAKSSHANSVLQEALLSSVLAKVSYVPRPGDTLHLVVCGCLDVWMHTGPGQR